VPRISCTLVDPELRLAFSRLDVDVETVLRARGEYASERAGDAPPVLGTIREIAARAQRDLHAARKELDALDPGLSVQLKKTGDQIRALVDRLVEKGERVHQNRSGKSRRHERRANNVVRPRGEPQERVLGPLPCVARFGEGWIEELAREMDPFQLEHLVVHLGDDDGAREGVPA
jgi:uncharacterized protein YllA (UPF0747 family)